jgi:predicted acetyltransferase
MIKLVVPELDYLPDYKEALLKDWSPDNVRLLAATKEQLKKIEENPQAFVHSLTDLEAKGPPITLPDGSLVPRLPGFRRWLWDNGFCGSFGFRYQSGGSTLPAHCLGHIGYSIVPWKKDRGYATKGLALLLEQVRGFGLEYVEITTDLDNFASQRVIEKNGGVLIEKFQKYPAYGDRQGLCYRIKL